MNGRRSGGWSGVGEWRGILGDRRARNNERNLSKE